MNVSVQDSRPSNIEGGFSNKGRNEALQTSQQSMDFGRIYANDSQ